MQRERVQISLRRCLFSGGVGRKLASGAYIVARCRAVAARGWGQSSRALPAAPGPAVAWSLLCLSPTLLRLSFYSYLHGLVMYSA
ncbi:hypothetical protein [Nitrosomonas sp. Nm34]|uniref:hypothetical protein n=1 Tax=Nitrosomonas sp. Nm34 TaxID=1881055 RepID=UPI0008EBA30E|nr:hypothetical protein [Nitrosomonas sp. Nm34]SFI95647.1 hypothetical protein SAMN05428978_106614 [Nitrosomonas sp. Nm34]